MHLFPPRLEIGDHEGFTPDKDIFGRSSIGVGLTNIVTSVTDPLVIAVDSEWGTGKTTFLKMWAGELRKQNIPVIYFDAFEHDYVEDAFTAIAGEIISLAAEKGGNNPAAKDFLKKSMGAAKIVLRSGLKLGIKLGSAGLLEAADLKDFASDLAKEASDLEDKYIGELLTKQKQEKQVLQSFRDALAVLPSLLTRSKNSEMTAEHTPLIIIIDELDRCRPSFSLQVLERIKHFFSVSGVHFVLATHLGQMKNSVSAVYGSGIDSTKYLQKFIQLTLHLVDSNQLPHERSTSRFIDYLISKMDSAPSFRIDFSRDYLKYIARCSNLSFRAIERIMSTLAIAAAYRPPEIFCPDPILVGLCVLKVVDPELYALVKSGQQTYQNYPRIHKILCFDSTPSELDKYPIKGMIQIWPYLSNPDVADDNPDFQGLRDRLFTYDLSRWDVIPIVARAVVERLSPRLT